MKQKHIYMKEKISLTVRLGRKEMVVLALDAKTLKFIEKVVLQSYNSTWKVVKTPGGWPNDLYYSKKRVVGSQGI